MQIKKGKWHNLEATFSYDCETKKSPLSNNYTLIKGILIL